MSRDPLTPRGRELVLWFTLAVLAAIGIASWIFLDAMDPGGFR